MGIRVPDSDNCFFQAKDLNNGNIGVTSMPETKVVVDQGGDDGIGGEEATSKVNRANVSLFVK